MLAFLFNIVCGVCMTLGMIWLLSWVMSLPSDDGQALRAWYEWQRERDKWR
jgi:hypothetical protein